MRDGIFILFVFLIIMVLTIIAVFIGMAVVALNPELSLWFRIPAFIFDIAFACFTGYLACTIKHDL